MQLLLHKWSPASCQTCIAVLSVHKPHNRALMALNMQDAGLHALEPGQGSSGPDNVIRCEKELLIMLSWTSHMAQSLKRPQMRIGSAWCATCVTLACDPFSQGIVPTRP